MEQFCKDVLKFLQSEYNDSYSWELEAHRELCGIENIELKIKINHVYIIKVTSNYMKHIYLLYRSGKYISERDLYEWQKELIDIIEGS